MNCDECNNKMGKSIRTIFYFESNGKTYTVYNVPTWYCDKCKKETMDKNIEENLKRYCNMITGIVINYSKMKDDDDAAAIAASSGMML